MDWEKIEGRAAAELLARSLHHLFSQSTFQYLGIEHGEHCAFSYRYNEHRTAQRLSVLACECYEYHRKHKDKWDGRGEV